MDIVLVAGNIINAMNKLSFPIHVICEYISKRKMIHSICNYNF